MVGAQVLCDSFGVRCFVEGLLVKADRVGLDAPLALRLHQCDDGAGVDTAGQKGAKRHVRHHLQPDRGFEPVVQKVDDVGVVGTGELRCQTGGHGRIEPPEGLGLANCGAWADLQRVPSGQLGQATVNATRRGDVGELHELGEHLRIDL